MLYTRYMFASKYCDGKDVLEVACGSGQGLGFLSRKAGKVIGGDCTENLIRGANQYYKGQIPLLGFDAHSLPFKSTTFDVVILFEAIYYLEWPEKFLGECRRILRKKGLLIICTVNKEWLDFNPSPFSTCYFSSVELSELLKPLSFYVELYGAFETKKKSLKDYLVSWLKRKAVGLRLIPKTMRGKEFLKYLFFGNLISLPQEITEGMARYCHPHPISLNSPTSDYKVIYAVCQKM